MKNDVFSTVPYEKKNSYNLINDCKQGNIKQVGKLLQQNRYLVHDFDNCFMTGLHWACRRNHHEIVKLLLEKGADPNQEDLIGRTALYYALHNQKEENLIILKYLLYHKANPWSSPKIDFKSICITFRQQKIISVARKVFSFILFFFSSISSSIFSPTKKYTNGLSKEMRYYMLMSDLIL